MQRPEIRFANSGRISVAESIFFRFHEQWCLVCYFLVTIAFKKQIPDDPEFILDDYFV